MKNKIVIEIKLTNGEERRIEFNSNSIKGLLNATEQANLFIVSQEKLNNIKRGN